MRMSSSVRLAASSSTTICIIGSPSGPLAGCHDGHGASGAMNRRKAAGRSTPPDGSRQRLQKSARLDQNDMSAPLAVIGHGPSKATAAQARGRLYNVQQDRWSQRQGYRNASQRSSSGMSVVLVTGGAGYIGSHVCKALADSGLTPVCYDTLEKGHRWAVRWGPLEQGDVGDGARLDEVFARHRPSAIVHLAGYIEVGESVREPARYLHNN